MSQKVDEYHEKLLEPNIPGTTNMIIEKVIHNDIN